MIALFTLSAAFALDTGSIDTAGSGADMAPCTGAWLEFLLPPDGADGVTPEAIPGVGVRTDCGTSLLMATLTGPDGKPQSVQRMAYADGIARFPELDLTADGTWTLEVQSGTSDGETFWAYGGLQATFTTGSGGIEPLAAAPTLDVLGSEYEEASEGLSVSLHLTSTGASGNAWQVLNPDGAPVAQGTEAEADLVVTAAATAGETACFTAIELLPDGEIGGASEPACATAEAKLPIACGCNLPFGGWRGGFVGVVIAYLLIRMRR